MQERREVILPSGAKLRIQLAPFVVSKNLYQSLLRELKSVEISSDMEMYNVIKDAFCVGFASPDIEKCLWACAATCTYEIAPGDDTVGTVGSGEVRVTPATFDPLEARQDYMVTLIEVAKDNVGPFTSRLYADFNRAHDYFITTLEAESQKPS